MDIYNNGGAPYHIEQSQDSYQGLGYKKSGQFVYFLKKQRKW